MKTQRYYTCREFLAEKYNTVARQLALRATDAESLALWQQNTRAALREILGLDRMVRCEPAPELLEEVPCEGYLRQKMLIQSEPGVYMPFYVLLPEGAREPRPAVIACHGHGSCGKLSVAGVRGIPEVDETIDKHHYDYGPAFARAGFMVFCPDARGFGERRESTGQGEEAAQYMRSTCSQLNKMAIAMGLSLAGMWVWDLQRLLDYIETRSDCIPGRVGCAGLSGGGLQTLWLSAMDERVAAAVVSGYFYGYRESLLLMSGNCDCNYVPHLYEKVDMGDLGALAAPRPLLVQTGSRDPLNGKSGLANVLSQTEVTCRAYELSGAALRFFHDVFEGEHRWDGKNSVPWMKKWLFQAVSG